jgi:hypothetical protein
VAWRRCSRRCRRPRQRGCSRSGSAPSPNADGSARLLPPTRAVVVFVLGTSSVFRCGRVSPRLDAPAAPPSPSLSRRSHWRRGKGKPQWGLVAWAPGSQPPLPLDPGAANVEAKAPSCPGFDRPGGRGGTAPLCAGQDAGVRGAGAKGVTPVQGRIGLACARAPVPRRAGRPDGKGVPSRARAAAAWLVWCGADPRRGKQG